MAGSKAAISTQRPHLTILCSSCEGPIPPCSQSSLLAQRHKQSPEPPSAAWRPMFHPSCLCPLLPCPPAPGPTAGKLFQGYAATKPIQSLLLALGPQIQCWQPPAEARKTRGQRQRTNPTMERYSQAPQAVPSRPGGTSHLDRSAQPAHCALQNSSLCTARGSPAHALCLLLSTACFGVPSSATQHCATTLSLPWHTRRGLNALLTDGEHSRQPISAEGQQQRNHKIHKLHRTAMASRRTSSNTSHWSPRPTKQHNRAVTEMAKRTAATSHLRKAARPQSVGQRSQLQAAYTPAEMQSNTTQKCTGEQAAAQGSPSGTANSSPQELQAQSGAPEEHRVLTP